MEIQEFFDKHNGRFVEFNQDQYKNQCVDLVQDYITDVLNLEVPHANAKDLFNAASDNDFIKILNEPTNYPLLGDIIILGEKVGEYGHCEIIKSAGIEDYEAFCENWPLGSPAHFRKWNYDGVIGWLRPKNKLPNQIEIKPSFTVRVEKAVANVRTEPNTKSALGGSVRLVRGDEFQATEIIKGENVSGNDKWFHSKIGNYVWSGGLRIL